MILAIPLKTGGFPHIRTYVVRQTFAPAWGVQYCTGAGAKRQGMDSGWLPWSGWNEACKMPESAGVGAGRCVWSPASVNLCKTT